MDGLTVLSIRSPVIHYLYPALHMGLRSTITFWPDNVLITELMIIICDKLSTTSLILVFVGQYRTTTLHSEHLSAATALFLPSPTINRDPLEEKSEYPPQELRLLKYLGPGNPLNGMGHAEGTITFRYEHQHLMTLWGYFFHR